MDNISRGGKAIGRAISKLKEAQKSGPNVRIEGMIGELEKIYDELKKEWTVMMLSRTTQMDSGNEE